jgi:spermidine synthase
MLNSKWFLEQTTDDEGSFHSLKEIIFAGRSEYQRIEIISTGSYGKCLVLDGKIQSSEIDEYIYHEALVHPALILSASPERILIAGGGEGATARESLSHPSISEIAVVDLDKYVVEACKKYLPEWHMGAFNDKRVKVFFEDARRFIEKSENFDVIIIDLPEPSEGGPAYMLYTKEFYENVHNCLKEDGIVVTQAASTSINNLKAFTAITNTIKQVFSVVRPYMVSIPSFFVPWGFVLASKKYDPLKLSPEYIQERLEGLKGDTRFYDYETHVRIFSLPKYLRDSIANEKLVITDSSPISFY